MAKNKKQKETPILSLDGNDYNIEDLSDDQKVILNHISDISRKVESTAFNLQQLQGGKEYFVGLLKNSLDEEK